MAVKLLRLDIVHGSSREDTIHETADPDDEGQLQEILHDWLAAAGWDRGRWHEFVIRADTGTRYTEVAG